MCDRLRRTIVLLLAAFCLTAGCLTCAQAEDDAGERVNRAFILGMDEFVSRESTYPSSTNNVFAMQETLQASGMPFETIFLPDQPVTSADELTALVRGIFADADDNDASYFYISTHGEYDPASGESATLLLSDGVTEGRLTAADLENAFAGIRGTKVLIFDACYSGEFIGKGMQSQTDTVHFLGEDFKVLCSSGAMEESWYWNTSESTEKTLIQRGPQGAFYFTQALSQSLSARNDYPADANRDGDITLRELYTYLLDTHAASTPQMYPQEDDFVVFRYDTSYHLDNARRSPVTDVTFSSSTLSAADNELTLEFIALRPVRVGYQIVYQRDGKWRFDEAQLIYDSAEKYTAFGDEPGAITAGRKVRTLGIDLQDGSTGGYVLVQVISIEDGKLTVHAGRVLAVPPADGDPQLTVACADKYAVSSTLELAIYVHHRYPCVLSVAVEDEQGNVVRRLAHRQSTRPMQIDGSTFYWNGRDKNGELVPEGTYRLRVSAVMNELVFTVMSQEIEVLSPAG